MKAVLALISLICSLSVCGRVAAQDPAPNLATDQLVGPVKTVEQVRVGYAFHDGNLSETARLLFRKTNYDRDGNRIEQITYQGKGEIIEKLVYTYDALKRNTVYDEYFHLTGQALLGPRKHIYTLDANGRPVDFILYESDGTAGSHFTYAYDQNGNKTEECFSHLNGKCMGRMAYTYDAKGHQLTQSSYTNDGTLAWKNVSTFDSSGHQIEWLQYQNGILRYQRVFRYDDLGRISEQETSEFNKPLNGFSDHAPEPGKIVYTYSEHSKQIANYNVAGALTSRQVVTSDEKGNEVSREFFKGDSSRKLCEDGSPENRQFGNSTQTRTEYDSHGNWIKRIHLTRAAGAKEPVPSSAEYRIITYYDE